MKTAVSINPVSEFNLKRDKNVLGANWKKTYNGYFGDTGNIHKFIETVFPYLPKRKKFKILYPAATSGFLGEQLSKFLKKKKIDTSLWLVDISEEHLNENNNPKTKKVLADITTLDLKEFFDIIMMRSSMDYFPNEKLQVRILRNLRKHLVQGGVFLNQTASMPSALERNLADKIYNSSRKIGHRHFQCDEDIGRIYKMAGFRIKKIGVGRPLLLTEKDHITRYEIGRARVNAIREIIFKVPKNKRPNIFTSATGYRLKFVFPIYAAWKI